MNPSSIGDAPIDLEVAGPSMPDQSRLRSSTQYGA